MKMPIPIDPTRYTPFFSYRPIPRREPGQRRLFCEEVDLARISESVGTPTYVYSRKSIETAYRKLDRAFGSLPHTLCYAVKANGNLSVLRVLARLGSSFDIVSGGELDRLRRIGASGDRIVFSGVGKSREEIREALRYPGPEKNRNGILLFNIESGEELEILLGEAARVKKQNESRVATAIRVNPDVIAGGHRHISTGHHQHKFGVDWEEARRLYLAHKDSRYIAWRGMSAHIGSQILSSSPYRRALTRMAVWIQELARIGVHLGLLDLGGGLGIRYGGEEPLAIKEYAKTLAKIVRPLGCRLLIEPGRTIVGPAGVLLTRVLYRKENRGKKFVVVDAGMNDLIRPVLYEASHPITPLILKNSNSPARRVDIVGPVCETGDFLARNRTMKEVEQGDVLAVWAAGAYGFVESSNYNARCRAAEILVNGKRFHVARRRETCADLIRGEC
jgi:diaminopimelate decarboxylase